uniref:Uncharacterized protein n=1 Tax=Oryza rufipogon TaxID=4529 RepID=A0A0E0NW24_ORYRU
MTLQVKARGRGSDESEEGVNERARGAAGAFPSEGADKRSRAAAHALAVSLSLSLSSSSRSRRAALSREQQHAPRSASPSIPSALARAGNSSVEGLRS